MDATVRQETETYRRRTRIAAPLADVWEFHSHISGLEALTPSWMNLRVEAIRGPNGEEGSQGEENPTELQEGTQIRASIRPFGVGPRQRWVSIITAREEGQGWAMFRDRMDEGPFPYWEHAHQFFGDGSETVIVDSVTYALPFGRLGGAVAPLAVVGFEPMFRYRHRRTKELLE